MDNETAVRLFYCRRPSPTASHMSAAAEQPTSGPQPDTPQPGMMPVPMSASTPSTWCRGRRKRDAPAQVIGGPGDASAHAAEGPADASASVPSLQGFEEEAPLNVLSSFWPLNPELRVRQALLQPLRVPQSFWEVLYSAQSAS
ncbi:hypothetical protein ILYODFUR_024876 [Ilyodon furcidens]|uniref:Uncharacterized protein n=1 Tax=Ilyodon furcidens TaxID=33524 RepID=A0ABV0U171_9TELE